MHQATTCMFALFCAMHIRRASQKHDIAAAHPYTPVPRPHSADAHAQGISQEARKGGLRSTEVRSASAAA